MRASRASSGSAASPSAREVVQRASGSWKPSRVRLPLVGGWAGSCGADRCADRSATSAKPVGQRLPRLVELGAGRLDLGEEPSASRPRSASSARARRRSPRWPTIVCVDLGVQLHAPHRRAEARDLDLAVGRLRRAPTAPGGGSTTSRSSTARRAAAWPGRAKSGSPAAAVGPADRRAARPAGRAGWASTRPPSAAATSWWPRQMPRVGSPRRRRRRGSAP